MMKTVKIVLVLLLMLGILPLNGLAAEQGDEVVNAEQKRFDAVGGSIEKYFEPSYVTALGGYDQTGNINQNDLFYEGQVYMHLNWLSGGSFYRWFKGGEGDTGSFFYNHIFSIYFPIRIQMRQLQSGSAPVRTPSYNPGIRLFYTNSAWLNRDNTEANRYLSLGFHHYSNGQSGDHIDSNTGLINTTNGSFSSDYVEFSYYSRTDLSMLDWTKLNVRKYLTGLTWERDQTAFYQTAVVKVSGKTKVTSFKLPLLGSFNISALAHLGYKFGRNFITPNVRAKVKDNIQFAVEGTLAPKAWSNLALYARWDYGYDYYNINYRNKMNRVQFGIVQTFGKSGKK